MDGQSQAARAALLALRGAGGLWFLVAAASQIFFAYYTLAFYGGAAIEGDLGRWADVLPKGIIPGEPLGNMALAVHLAVSVILSAGGPLQLTPQIRAIAPVFHRFLGRTYMTTAVLASLSGLYIVWTRRLENGLDLPDIGISLNAVLILIFAAIALNHAMARRIDIHRRWAMRLFLAVSGVWFFRVALMLWIMINQAPVGVGENFDGPTIVAITFGQYLVPLAVLELYFRACDGGGAVFRSIMALVMTVAAVATAAGSVAAYLILWAPRL